MLSQYKTYKPYFTRSDLLKIDPPQSFNFQNLSNKEKKEKKEILNLKEQVKILTDMVISCQKDVEDLRLQVNKEDKNEEEEDEDKKTEEKVNKDDENKSGSKYLLYFSSAAILSSIYYTFKKR